MEEKIYERTFWRNDVTQLNADNMNNIENGIEATDKGTVIFDKLFADAVAFAEKKNVPLYCGEYGVIDQAPIEDTVRWFEDIHATFEKYGIGRAVWNYKQKDFGIVDPHYEEILDEVVKNL